MKQTINSNTTVEPEKDHKEISEDIFSEMATNWSSPIVARTQIWDFTGGMISAKYMANLDSEGVGPARIRIGRRIGYPVKTLVEWLRDRSDFASKSN